MFTLCFTPAFKDGKWCKTLLKNSLRSFPFLSFTEVTVILKFVCLSLLRASLIAQVVKNPPAMQETPVQFLGWEDPLEKG